MILRALALLTGSASSFGFEDLFGQAFGGGGGGFQFQMGGGRPRAAQLPQSVKNEISDDFAWLRGTEWTLNARIVLKFSIDGFVQTNTQECNGPSQCVYAAYDGQIYVSMLQSGLYSMRPEKVPQSTDAADIEKIVISGKREADRVKITLKFNRIYDTRSREDALDLYAVLGVDFEASTGEIKKAFRRLTLELHPDQNQGDPTAQAKFNDATRASEILSDPTKRMLYDTGGMEAIRSLEKGEVQKGQDVLFEINVPLSMLFTGGNVAPTYRRRVVCTGCRSNPRLERCGGCSKCPTELRTVSQQVGPGFYIQQQVQVDSKEWCKMEEKPLEVNIPRGARNGDDVVMEGAADQRPGMIPGNVIVRLKQQPDASFHRDGHNLKTFITITLREALLGFRKDIVMPDQSIVPIVTNGVTQPQQVMKVQGEGMPKKDDPGSRGDLVITVVVQLPTSLTSEEKASIGDIFDQPSVAGNRAGEL
jgi:DnaJ-class molecular chaperone